MPAASDLDAAVAGGIITADQAAKIAALWASRDAGASAAMEPGPADVDAEAIRFARGFHDVFLTVGIALLLLGIAIAGGIILGSVGGAYAAAAAAFALAFFFAGRRRLVLPSIALAIGVTAFVVIGTAALVDATAWSLFSFRAAASDGARASLIVGLAALAASAAYYATFRLPFALGPVAVSLMPVVYGLEVLVFGADGQTVWLPTMLILGLATFVAAMAFDLLDPVRRTVNADNAFWLHLAAAPMIVRSVISLVADRGRFAFSPEDALVVLAVVCVLGLVAVVIDRRALLVAGLGYLGFAVAVLIRDANMPASGIFATTLVILGASVVVLGSNWRQARRAILGRLPKDGPLRFLPPINGTT